MIKQTIIRLIPFRLRTPLRALYHSLKYRIGVLVGGRDPLIPPDSLHSVGPGHYVAVGFAELMGIANGYQRSRCAHGGDRARHRRPVAWRTAAGRRSRAGHGHARADAV